MEEAMKEFDVVIIGGGPGGYVAAIRGAQRGASVALVERGRLGGTCLNRGCIPTKALYYSAKALTGAKKAAAFGVSTGDITFDLAKAVERKEEVVDKLVGGVGQLLKGNGVEVIAGTARLESKNTVAIDTEDGQKTIKAKSIIIATGSEPAMIPAFNIDRENVLTSTEILNLTEIPESLLIIGGGVMGCEFATLFANFGTKVTIVELMSTILSSEDKQVVRVIAKRFKTLGVDVHTSVTVESVEVGEGDSVTTTLVGGESFMTEKVLVSIGRSFNSGGLRLEPVGVELDRGRVVVNERMETSVEGVFAIGDVTGGILLAHVASVEGEVAIDNALGKSAEMDYSAIPGGIFTDPEIASVGLREKDAIEKGIEVKVGRFPYAACGKALTMNETEGFVQIVSDPETDVVLGSTIVGAHATDLLGEVALAVKTGAKVQDIIDTVHAHPTLPEMVLEAAEDIHGVAVHKISRASRGRKK